MVENLSEIGLINSQKQAFGRLEWSRVKGFVETNIKLIDINKLFNRGSETFLKFFLSV